MHGTKKFKIATLGCRTNQYESQAYADQLKALGYTEVQDEEIAEICIVNTCTVTESADSHSRQQIRRLGKEHPGAKLIVTGCLADRIPDEIQAMPHVAHVVSNREKEQLLSSVFPGEELPEFSIQHFAAHTRAFVKVQDGCNSFCTYCIIPYVRGRSRSRRIEEILAEIRALIGNGYKEVVLTGINIGDFDGAPQAGEPPRRLAELVRQVDAIEGLKRLRLSSIDPDEVDDELAEVILNGKNTCHSMHIVLQSGSNGVLKKMNRKYTRQQFFKTVERLRSASPRFTFTTDIIVGFPGETEGDFHETLEVMQEVQFAKVHMFPYSERKRTRAALFPNKVPPEVIQNRKQVLLRMAEKQAFALRSKFVGHVVEVLLEKGADHASFFTGHTDNFLEVWISKREGLAPNQIVCVKLSENKPEGLLGTLVE